MLIFSFKTPDVLNTKTFLSRNIILSFVWGFLPRLARLFLTENLPKPEMRTSSPLARVVFIISNSCSISWRDSGLVRLIWFWIWIINLSLVKVICHLHILTEVGFGGLQNTQKSKSCPIRFFLWFVSLKICQDVDIEKILWIGQAEIYCRQESCAAGFWISGRSSHRFTLTWLQISSPWALYAVGF